MSHLIPDPNTHRLLSGVLCLLSLLIAVSSVTAGELDGILSPTNAWVVIPSLAREWDFSLHDESGQPALSSPSRSMAIQGAAPYGPDTEVAMEVRFRPGDQSAVLRLLAAPATESGTGGKISLSLNARPGQEDIYWWATDPNGGEPSRGLYALKGVTERSLTWPSQLLQAVEQDMAALPSRADRWIKVRIILRADSYRLYLDDCLLAERRLEGSNTDWTVRFSLSPLVAVRSLIARRAEPEDARFVAVPVGARLNASAINGAPLPRGSLPPAGQTTTVDGVPFMLPPADGEGRNHIDLEPSWLQQGSLEGGFSPKSGSFGGRWAGALNVNPCRIQFRVPNARYSKLHLLAAADDDADQAPIVTAQFYRPLAGFPANFTTRVAPFAAGMQTGTIHHVVLPLDEGALARFANLDYLEFELTKQVRLYRVYPDPGFYSFHQAGLPSSVHVFAATLEKPAIDLDFQPGRFAHIWTAPEQPAYTVSLRNRTDVARKVALELTTVSHDGAAMTRQTASVDVLPSGQEVIHSFELKPERYGHHEVVLTLRDGAEEWVERRSLLYLRADTRERGGWDHGRGILFGMWNWRGGHDTPKGVDVMRMMVALGSESISPRSLSAPYYDEEELAVAREAGMVCHQLTAYPTPSAMQFSPRTLGFDFDPDRPEEMAEKLVAWVRENQIQPSAINRPQDVRVFSEPHIGGITSGNLPLYWGDPEYVMNDEEQERFDSFLERFLVGVPAVKKAFPQAKILLPHGSPLFCVPFLRYSKEAAQYIDGVGIDFAMFERLPEQQLHQCSLHRMWEFWQEWHKAGKAEPDLVQYEGPAIGPVLPGALTEDQRAGHLVRAALLLAAYGVDRQLSLGAPFAPSDYWGTQHYGAGHCNRVPFLNPFVSAAAYATLTRQLNRMNFEKWVPTGSLSVYCLQFKHYETGERVHVLWTVRGTRPVTVGAPKDADVVCCDLMDNDTALGAVDGKVAFEATTLPCFVRGLPASPTIALGAPDHSDSAPGPLAVRMANLGDGAWTLSDEPDSAYTDSNLDYIRRFPGKMTATPVEAPPEQGAKALAVALGAQDKERFVMPYYTSLVPQQPVTISGKASHLGLWVKASSDWGRVVYCLRDANGERWISVGARDKWNCDDTHGWSAFCFDGWRYLRFELPANAAYDSYREAGSTWWGHYGSGDGIVDLPLRIEKIIVERRTHALYVNDLQPTQPDDVLLADLYAEYEADADQTDEAVRLSRLRMPVPADAPEMGNPVAELAASGVLDPLRVRRVTPPDHQYDGTRCHVHFDEVEGAASYDVWVSTREDGRGALCLGKGWTASGGLILGLRPDTDFYVFVIYTDGQGRHAKPSEAFQFRLKDMFAEK